MDQNEKMTRYEFLQRFYQTQYRSCTEANGRIFAQYEARLLEAANNDIKLLCETLFGLENKEQGKNLAERMHKIMQFRKEQTQADVERVFARFAENFSLLTRAFDAEWYREYGAFDVYWPADWQGKISAKTVALQALSAPKLDVSKLCEEKTSGAVAGALIGSIFGLGLGTIVGAAIGGYLDSQTTDDLPARKKEVWGSVYPQLTDYYNRLLEATRKDVASITQALEERVSTVVASLAKRRYDEYEKRERELRKAREERERREALAREAERIERERREALAREAERIERERKEREQRELRERAEREAERIRQEKAAASSKDI